MVRPILAALALFFLGALPSGAQTPGAFDYYLLSLSWSPSHCEAVGPRNDPDQCQRRSLGFVVHGLWPEFEHGFPLACPTREAQPTSSQISSVLDLIPTSALVRHEWREHGTCSGLSARYYFDLVRAARMRIAVPPLVLSRSGQIAPAAIEGAFIAANSGLTASAIAVTCENDRLAEVRICLSKGLDFRSCPEVDRAGCRLPQVRIPQTG